MAREISPFAPLDRAPSRVIVAGTTGSGKTTLAEAIAGAIGAPHVELDALHWEPNWTQAADDVFRARVGGAVAGERWVVDGNYSKVNDLTWPRAELLVWLDYSITRVSWQLLCRTTRRARTQEALWQGNRERLRTAFFSRQSLFVWALQTHWKRRRTLPAALASPANGHLDFVRIRSRRELGRFLRELRRAAGETRPADAPALRRTAP
ncbi:MAG: AAA family ATPase [Dehalococcoidia bacterium]|nr:AAA family ATPase [Dehalococcoidia bacterium]